MTTEAQETMPPVPAEPATEAEATEQPKGNREAAKYRTQLRDTESKLAEAHTTSEALQNKLGTLNRMFVEHLAATGLKDPADLWRYGADLEAMLTDEGTPDPEKVTAAVQDLLTERPHLTSRPTPKPDPSQGARGANPIGTKDPVGDALSAAMGR